MSQVEIDMPVQKMTSLERAKGEEYATLRFYEYRSRYEEDNEIPVSCQQLGWVRIHLNDLGKVMIERKIYEFYSEEDMKMHCHLVAMETA